MGLSLIQVAIVLGAIVAAVGLWNFKAPPLAGLAVIGSGMTVGLWRHHGRPAVESAPEAIRAGSLIVSPRSRRWRIDVADRSLPPLLGSQELVAVPAARFGAFTATAATVVHDRRTGLWAATVRVEGGQFALISRPDQDRLVGLWADALAPFSRESSPVAWIRWSEWAAPASGEEHAAWLETQVAVGADDPARVSYEELRTNALPSSTGHEVLVTVAVNERRCARHTTTDGTAKQSRGDAAVEVLAREVRLFIGRLEAAGLTVTGPLDAAATCRAVAERLDPYRSRTLDAVTRTLGDRTGAAVLDECGPTSSTVAAHFWQADATFHRGLYVAEWPRFEVPADWLAPLMLFAGSVRSISVFLEPVAPSRSHKAIATQAAKLDSDAEQRVRTGFRVGAAHRGQRDAVEQREAELVAGFCEQTYAGLVDVAADSEEELDLRCAELTQAAAACGVELRELWWRHDQVTAAAVPLAYGLARRRTAGD